MPCVDNDHASATPCRDERELVIVRNADELNQMTGYEMITEAPRVEITYEKKKHYCPKYKISFYVRIVCHRAHDHRARCVES